MNLLVTVNLPMFAWSHFGISESECVCTLTEPTAFCESTRLHFGLITFASEVYKKASQTIDAMILLTAKKLKILVSTLLDVKENCCSWAAVAGFFSQW